MPAAPAPDQLLAALHWRYATKVFDASKKIPNELWSALEEALVLTPSSYGLQPWKFVVITDAAVKAKLPPVSWNQTQPADCSHLVVFAAPKNFDEAHVDRFAERIAEVRGVTKESIAGYVKMMKGGLAGMAKAGEIESWMANQIYIALGQFMAAAALLGVDTCPMEGIDRARYDEILGLAAHDLTTVVACPAGYRAAGDKYAAAAKVRFATEDVIVRIA